MTKKIRLIILLLCVACFFTATPVLIAYSMGYRINFEKMKLVATGGIYVRTFPPADQITIDGKYFEKPGMFANSVFVQNLLPDRHSVLIKKEGFYDYQKTISVEEKEVTKLENVLLFKKDISFQKLADEAQNPFLQKTESEKFVIVSNNLYYSDAKQNDGLTTAQKNTSLIKGAVAFSLSGNNIIWLSTSGALYQSGTDGIIKKTGEEPVQLAEEKLLINKKGSYKITIYGQNIFINSNGTLLLLDKKTSAFEILAKDISDFKISPDGKNIAYSSSKYLYLLAFSSELRKEVLLYKSEQPVSDCAWLNNDYVIMGSGSKIIISEIDYRGSINSVEIPENFVSPQIIFNQQDNKLYVLSQKEVFVSDKLVQ